MLKWIKAYSIFIQALFAAVCVFEITICLIFSAIEGTIISDFLLIKAFLLLLSIAFLIPDVLVCFVLNVAVCFRKGDSKRCRAGQIVLAVLLPVLCVGLFAAMSYVFVSVTGGV